MESCIKTAFERRDVTLNERILLRVRNCFLLPLGTCRAKQVRQTLFSRWIMSKDVRTSSTKFLAGLVVVFNGEFFYDVVLLQPQELPLPGYFSSFPFVSCHPSSNKLREGNVRKCKCCPQLSKGYIALSIGLITIHWITQLILIALIRWIVIYPVERAIHPLKNWSLVTSSYVALYGWLFPSFLSEKYVSTNRAQHIFRVKW